MAIGDFPEAQAPDRQYRVDAGGVHIAVNEWGDESAPPLFLVHGGFDFSRTFEVFAPKLAAGGWRVVGWDQRGHGDSEHAALYAWEGDIRDAVAVMSSVSGSPAPVIGHSKGGALMIHLADAQPFRFTHLVNIDGIPWKKAMPDVAEHERTRMASAEVAKWLDHRRRTATAQRKPGTIEELAVRRQKQNPRLSIEWLQHLAVVGARHDADGWRWKIDPSLHFGGFGPWRPEWAVQRLPGLPMPFLGIVGSEPEPMGWGIHSEDIRPFLPLDGEMFELTGSGHFVHIEQPDVVAAKVLDFLGSTP
jgi:pimeloyl-ACP methyl ester carboxylesterase